MSLVLGLDSKYVHCHRKKVGCAILRGSKDSGMQDRAGERGSVEQVLGNCQPKASHHAFCLSCTVR